MQIHEIKREHPEKKRKTVGRGGKRGTTSGRGTKGQLARSGRKLRPEFRDVIKTLPKLRGYRFGSIVSDSVVLDLSEMAEKFNDGDKVSPKELRFAGLVETYKGKMPKIKILGGAEIKKKLYVSDCKVSKSAKDAIVKAGGSVKE